MTRITGNEMVQQTIPQAREKPTRPIVSRFLARRLWSSAPHQTLADSVASQRRAYDRAIMVVRAFYVVSVLWAVQTIGTWPGYARLQSAHPLWPAEWWF